MLKEVVVTGVFCGVHLSDVEGTICDKFGKPESQLLSEGMRLLKFGSVQVAISGDVVTYIIVSLSGMQPHEPWSHELRPLSSSTLLYQLLDYLDEEDVSWAVESRYTYDRQLAVRIGTFGLCFFDLDHRECQHLKLVTPHAKTKR